MPYDTKTKKRYPYTKKGKAAYRKAKRNRKAI